PHTGLADLEELLFLVIAVDPPGAPGVAGVDGDCHVSVTVLHDLDARAVPALRPRPGRRLPVAVARDLVQPRPLAVLLVLDLEPVGVLRRNELLDVEPGLVPHLARALPQLL